MKNEMYIALMQWPERNESICVGTNKKKVRAEAYKMLREEHGKGPVPRPRAMCSMPIMHDDILIETIRVCK